MVIQLSAVQLL